MGGYAEIEHRQGELEKIRSIEEPKWRDIARLMQSDEDLTSANNKHGRADGDDPYDSTPLYALDDYVGGIFTKAVNPAERWFEYGVPNDPALANWKPAKEYLWNYTNLIYASFDPTRDNFYLSAPAWFADMGMLGTGFVWQEELVGQGTIIARNFPIAECYKDVDANGELDTFHRKFRLTGRQAKAKFKGHSGTSAFRDDEDINFVHAIFPNPDYRPGMMGPRGMRFRSCYASPDKKDFYQEGGYHEMPVHQIEWSMRSGRAWARGPGHNALPDMSTNDEVARSALIAIQSDAEPMWWAADEDVMSQADIVPNNILYGDAVSGGKPPMQIIERQKQMSLPLQLQNDLRNQIRRAFRFGLASVMAGRPQMTAEEVMAYSSEELKALAPNLVRIHRGLGTAVTRRAQLLERMGVVAQMIGPPPPELLRANVSIQFVSPFAKAQKADVGRGVMSWVNTKAAMFERTKDARWLDSIDVDGVDNVLHDTLSGVPSVKLDQRVIDQQRQARAAAAQQQMKLEQSERAAAVVADVSHAQQASTLAKGRGQ